MFDKKMEKKNNIPTKKMYSNLIGITAGKGSMDLCSWVDLLKNHEIRMGPLTFNIVLTL